MRLIDADALMWKLQSRLPQVKTIPTWILDAILDEPTIDVEPVRHGRWGHERLPSTSGGSYSVVRCSECKYQYPMTEVNYCPNCGARMDGGELIETD